MFERWRTTSKEDMTAKERVGEKSVRAENDNRALKTPNCFLLAFSFRVKREPQSKLEDQKRKDSDFFTQKNLYIALEIANSVFCPNIERSLVTFIFKAMPLY